MSKAFTIAIGPPAEDAIKWLKRWQELGARLILWTMRSEGRADGSTPLIDALDYCRINGIEFWGVNGNPDQGSWTQSPKAYANIYVDDAAFGCPLKDTPDGRPVVDWSVVGPAVEAVLLAHG